MRRPELTSDNVLIIRAGRHPLTEMLVDSFIANDCCITEDQGRVNVITGPNRAGKSCYAKQVIISAAVA